jgi:5-methylcytosine-specific restriction endonuclease McrA
MTLSWADEDDIDYMFRSDAVFWTIERAAKHNAMGADRLAMQRRSQSQRRAERIRLQRCECCTTLELRHFYKAAHSWGMQVDHAVALANGGKHCRKNLQVLSVADHKRKTGPISAYRKTELKRDRNK